jgi:hypothetical protein
MVSTKHQIAILVPLKRIMLMKLEKKQRDLGNE